MEMFITYLDWTVVLFFVFITLFSILLLRKRTPYPPGPPAFPLIGSIGFLRRLAKLPPHKAFVEAATQYGGILSIWVGPKLYVVLNGYNTIRQAFVGQAADFMDRPNWIPQLAFGLRHGKGVSFSNGIEWTVMKKFTMESLREFGVGKSAFEQIIQDEVDELSVALRSMSETGHNLSPLWKKAASNVTSTIVFGQRFDYSDRVFHDLLENIDIVLNGTGFTSVTNFLPKLLHPFFRKDHESLIEKEKATFANYALINGIIENHEATFDASHIRDFIDIYIQVSRNETELSKEEYINKGNIFRLIYDMLIAGSEPTGTSLSWLFLYMIENPDIQTRCRSLIKKLAGDRTILLSDRPSLTYIDATIQEMLRCSNVVPLGVPRTCIDHDIAINGFTIPKRTLVLANLYSANTDPNYWNDPFTFNPDRFLDDNAELIKHEAFIPMSIGPRSCFGFSFGKIELFLIFSNLLQRFEFIRDKDSKQHEGSPKEENFMTLVPETYKLKCVPIM